MKIKDVRFSLSGAVAPLMSEHGFADRNHDANFKKKSGDFVLIYELRVYAETGWFFTKPAVGVGGQILNKLYNQIIQPKDRIVVNGLTVGLGFGISNEHKGRGYYTIENADDIAVAAVKIKSDFVEIALPYYKNNQNLESVEKTLNPKKSDGSYVPTTVSAACMGLIAAHLCGRTDFESLADFYIATAQRKEFAAPILKVKEFYLKSGNKEVQSKWPVVKGKM